jgi:hypothetical protein
MIFPPDETPAPEVRPRKDLAAEADGPGIWAPLINLLWGGRRRRLAWIFIVALALRLWAAWQLPVDADEPVYLEAAFGYAQAIRSGDWAAVIDYRENAEHPPLTKLLYAGSVLAQGDRPNWWLALNLSRMISALFGSLAVLIVAGFDPLAGALLAVHTMVVKYTSQAYLEALPMLAAIGSVFALRRSSGPDRWFWLSGAALGLTAAGKFSYFPILGVVGFIFLVEQKRGWRDLGLYLLAAGAVFLALDPALWRNPVGRLFEAVSFHAAYAQGAHVQEVNYPWWKPLDWVARSWPFQWHPQVFFYLGFDGLITLGTLAGVWFNDLRGQLNEPRRPWVAVWVGVGMLFLLLWPTKWPQYTLVVLPAFCLAAAPPMRWAYHWLREQETYWDWFKNMFPRPTRWLGIALLTIVLILTVGALANSIYIALQSLGWSNYSTTGSGLPSNAVYDVARGYQSEMALATENGAVIWQPAQSDQVLERWSVYTPENSGLPARRALAVIRDGRGGYWFGTQAGLAYFDGAAWQSYTPENSGLPAGQVNALALDQNGRLWVGTPAGAAVFDGQAWQAYTADNSGLAGAAVFSVALQEGQSGTKIWFGGLEGVACLDAARGEWQTFTAQDFDFGWGGAADILVDSNGAVWVATLGGGLNRWDGQSWRYYRTSNSDIPYNTVSEIEETKPGLYWIGTALPNAAGGVLARFDGQQWRTYTPNLSGYSGAEVLAVAQDDLGRLWFATRTSGVDVYDPAQGR